jgi:predicted AlkP superfamily phosphohydrolase/phosphomutase
VALKTALLEDTLQSESWDLFTACFGETHCVGHQFWHFQDERHPWHEVSAAPAFKDAMLAVYRLVDAGIGRLIAAAGPEADVFVVASHGMGPYTGGPNLLDEILARLGLAGAVYDSWMGQLIRGLQRHQGHAAHLARATLRPLLGRTLLRRAQAEFGALHAPLTNPALRAASLPNNRCGAIRLNLKGREPFGAVAAGNEAAALIEDIRGALSELRCPRTGAAIVEQTVTAREAFGPDHHPDVPDLMIVYRDDLGILDACVSPRLGRIEAPVYKRILPRSGDHTTQSRIWMAGRDIPHGSQAAGHVLDLAPTVLVRLGLPAAGMDGRPLLSRPLLVRGEG